MTVYLALGANQPAKLNGEILSPAQTFKCALTVLAVDEVTVLATSNLWQSPAWPDPDAQAAYINAVVAVQTDLTPLKLLERVKQTEASFGRLGTARNEPRPLDIDVLDYNGQILRSRILTLPHPRMLIRPFVLLPLAEIAANWRDPIKKRALQDWTARLSLRQVAPLQRLGPLL